MENPLQILFNKEESEYLVSLFDSYFLEQNLLGIFEERCKDNTVMHIAPSIKMIQVLNLFGGYVQAFQSQKTYKKLSNEDFNRILVFSLLWGIGGSYEQEERKVLEGVLKSVRNAILPPDSYYDYYLDMKETGCEWRLVQAERWIPQGRIQFS